MFEPGARVYITDPPQWCPASWPTIGTVQDVASIPRGQDWSTGVPTEPMPYYTVLLDEPHHCPAREGPPMNRAPARDIQQVIVLESALSRVEPEA
jgi:hypothetical protein